MLSGDFAGVWWLPENPEKTWGGFLHLADGQQPQLHVAGLMTEFTKRLAAIIDHPVILGVTADGKLVTLFDGTETGGQMQLFSEVVGETIVTAPRAYVGNHLASEAAAGFRRISLRLTYLDAWFPAPRIERQIDLDSKRRLRRGVLTFEPTSARPAISAVFVTQGRRRISSTHTGSSVERLIRLGRAPRSSCLSVLSPSTTMVRVLPSVGGPVVGPDDLDFIVCRQRCCCGTAISLTAWAMPSATGSRLSTRSRRCLTSSSGPTTPPDRSPRLASR